MVARANETFTPEQYITRERSAETKSEYINGYIYAMAGASPTHNTLTANIGGSLYSQLRGSPCQSWSNDMRVKVSETGMYTYPDVLVVCGPELEDDTLLNPTVIVEVLSPSTEAYDRGNKFAHYQRLSSLTDYVLISQDRMRMDHFQRQSDGSWLLRVAEAEDDSITLSSIGCRLIVREVYERVSFDDTALGSSRTAPTENPQV